MLGSDQKLSVAGPWGTSPGAPGSVEASGGEPRQVWVTLISPSHFSETARLKSLGDDGDKTRTSVGRPPPSLWDLLCGF